MPGPAPRTLRVDQDSNVNYSVTGNHFRLRPRPEAAGKVVGSSFLSSSSLALTGGISIVRLLLGALPFCEV